MTISHERDELAPLPSAPAGPPPSPEEVRRLLDGIGPRRTAFNRVLTRGVETTIGWLQAHWLALINGILGGYIGLAVVSPLLYAFGLNGPASTIFNAYRFVCAQTPSHSFFIGGYQVCLCSRCLAIYASILLAGLVLSVLRRRGAIRGLPFYVWLLGMVPMALDGFTQLFGLRESNLELRLLTGAIFGLTTAWYLLPQIENAAAPEPAPAYQGYYSPPAAQE